MRRMDNGLRKKVILGGEPWAVLHFDIGSLKKGGAERVFVNLATYFLEQGCSVTMVTQYKKENEYELPAGIRRVISDLTPEEEGGRIVNLFRRYKKLRRIFREIHADVVLSTIGKNNFMALLANAFLPTKVVVSVVAEPTEEYPTKGMRLLAKTLFYAADGIVMQTADAVRFFQPSLQKKCVILKNSLNPAFVRLRYEGDRRRILLQSDGWTKIKTREWQSGHFVKLQSDSRTHA